MSDSELKPPIILLGHVRSGTSLIQGFFGLSDEVCTWFEPRTVWAYAAPGRKHDRFTRDDASPKVKRYIRKRICPRDLPRVAPDLPAAQPALADVQQRVPLAECAQQEPVQDPPARDTQHPAPLLRLAAAARQLSQTRAAQEACLHLGRALPGDLRGQEEADEELIAKQWVQASKTCRADLDEIERSEPGSVYRIRYEDFIYDPAKYFAQMCEHVGLGVDQQILDEVAQQADTSSQDKWKRLDPEVIQRIKPIVEEEMRINGYEFPTELPTEEERQEILSREKLSVGGQGSTVRSRGS